MTITPSSTKSPFFTETNSMPPVARQENKSYLRKIKQRNLSEVPLRVEVIENIIENNKMKLLNKNIKLLQEYAQRDFLPDNVLPDHIFNDLKKFFGDVLETLTDSNQKESLRDILKNSDLTIFAKEFKKRIEDYRAYIKANFENKKDKSDIFVDDAQRLKYTSHILKAQSLPFAKSQQISHFILKNAEKWFDFPVKTLENIYTNMTTLKDLPLRPHSNIENLEKNEKIKNYMKDNLTQDYKKMLDTKDILELGCEEVNQYIVEEGKDWFEKNSSEHIKNFLEFMGVIDKEDILYGDTISYLEKAFHNSDKLNFVIENYKKRYSSVNQFILEYISDNRNIEDIKKIFDNVKKNEKNFSQFSRSEENIFALELKSEDNATINNAQSSKLLENKEENSVQNDLCNISNEKIISYMHKNIHRTPLKLQYTVYILALNDRKMEDCILRPYSQWLDNSVENLKTIYWNVRGNYKRLDEIEKDDCIKYKEDMINYIKNNIEQDEEKIRYISYILNFNNLDISKEILKLTSKWLNRSIEEITDIYQNMYANTNLLNNIRDDKRIQPELKTIITSYINKNITRNHRKMKYLVEKLQLDNPQINDFILNPYWNLFSGTEKDLKAYKAYIETLENSTSTTSRDVSTQEVTQELQHILGQEQKSEKKLKVQVLTG